MTLVKNRRLSDVTPQRPASTPKPKKDYGKVVAKCRELVALAAISTMATGFLAQNAHKVVSSLTLVCVGGGLVVALVLFFGYHK